MQIIRCQNPRLLKTGRFLQTAYGTDETRKKGPENLYLSEAEL